MSEKKPVGRPPVEKKRQMFGVALPPDLIRKIRQAAKKSKAKSLSSFVEALLSAALKG